jgi:hypothetical protein
VQKGFEMELLTLLLVIITGYYAYITDRTLKLLHKQTILSMTPMFSINTLCYEQLMEEYFKEIKQDTDYLTHILKIQRSSIRFVCFVENLTDHTASTTSMYIYDSTDSMYAKSIDCKSFFKKKENARYYFTKPFLCQQELIDGINETYGKNNTWILDYLKPQNNSFAAIIYSDLEGTLHITKRDFYYQDESTIIDTVNNKTYTNKLDEEPIMIISIIKKAINSIRY